MNNYKLVFRYEKNQAVNPTHQEFINKMYQVGQKSPLKQTLLDHYGPGEVLQFENHVLFDGEVTVLFELK